MPNFFRADAQQLLELGQQIAALRNTMTTKTDELSHQVQVVAAGHNDAKRVSGDILSRLQPLAEGLQRLQQSQSDLNSRLENTLQELHAQIRSGMSSTEQLVEKLAAERRASDVLNHSGLDRLSAQIVAQSDDFKVLQKALVERLDRLDDWNLTLPPYEGGDESAWIDRLFSSLQRLAQSHKGRVHLFAVQLDRHLRSLYELSSDIPTMDLAADSNLQQLDRSLFKPSLVLQWVDIGDEEYGAAGMKSRARDELRAIETAILNYRHLLQERLKARHFRIVDIVPHRSTFDPIVHETADMYTVSTSEQDKDNRIISVERNGYQFDGEVLRRALVRRFSWDGGLKREVIPGEAQVVENMRMVEPVASPAPVDAAPPVSESLTVVAGGDPELAGLEEAPLMPDPMNMPAT